VVAINTGLLFLFGEAVTGSVGSPIVVLLAFVALFSTWAREIYKDIEDMKADKRQRRTLPLAEGIVAAATIAGAFLVIAVALTPVPFLAGLLPLRYLAMIGAVDVGLLAIAFTAPFQRKAASFHSYAMAVKILQLGALAAFAAGAF
jgi:geranylgeranylglycerol-phosphate geranylgeranyltransferase